MKLTSGDVCEITGIPMNTLDRWVGAGYVGPDNAFEGHGRHRTYTLAQCLAIAVGIRYRAEGASPDRVAGVVHFLASRPIEQTENDLAAGRTFLVPSASLGLKWIPGLMIEPPADVPPGAAALMQRIDLEAILKAVSEKIEQMSAQPAKGGRGRVRGLEKEATPA